MKIVRPLNKNTINNGSQLDDFLTDLDINELKMIDFVADNPKRSIVRQALNHASTFACEYCVSPAVRCENKLASVDRKKNDKKIDALKNNIQFLQERPGTSE